MIFEVFIEYLKISAFLSILITAVLSVSEFVGKRFRRTWRLSVWIIVGFAAVFPVGLFSVLMQQTRALTSIQDAMIISSPILKRLHFNLPLRGDVSFADIVTASEPSFLYSIINAVPHWITLIWIGGMLVQSVLIILRYRKFNKFVFKYAYPLDKHIDIPFLQGKAIPVFVNTYLPTSITTGFLNPRIIMETDDIDSEEFRVVLAHECMHCKRRDLWKKLLFQIVLIVHWFNPIMHRLPHLAGNDIELCCDESILKYYGKEYSDVYAKTLGKLAIASFDSSCSATLGFCIDQDIVMVRLRSVYDNAKSIKLPGAVSCVILVILLGLISHGIHGPTSLFEIPGFQGYYDSAIYEWYDLNKEIQNHSFTAKSALEYPDAWHNYPRRYCAENELVKPHIIYGNGYAALYYKQGFRQWSFHEGDRIHITISFDNSYFDSTGIVVLGYIKDGRLPDSDNVKYCENIISYMETLNTSSTDFIVPETGHYSFYALRSGNGPQYINWVRITY